jgi:Yip1-like protein
MASLAERMIGAARLDAGTYEEVEADTTATRQAALVVVISSLCIAIGAQLQAGVVGVVAVTVLRLLAWWTWALVAWLVGTRLLPGPATEADLGQLLRTVGFASAPGVAAILGVVPGIQGVVGIVVSLWMIATMVVAVRQALDYETTGRAIAVVVVGFLAYFLIAVVLTSLFVGAPPTP